MKIRQLSICAENIEKQRHFYEKILDLKAATANDSAVAFHLRNSILKLIKCPEFKPYHFAFTIPANKIEEALAWLKERVEILTDDPREIVDFPAWNAKSIYFYDADKNIVEFIARKNLDTATHSPFHSSQILEISEIGLATSHFKEKLNQLTSFPGIEKFSGGREVFCAIGSERGLVILIDKDKKDWFPSGDTAYSANFQAIFEVENSVVKMEFNNEKIIFG